MRNEEQNDVLRRYQDEANGTKWNALSMKIVVTLYVRKNIFAYLFSVLDTISLSRHEQVCLMRLCLNILVHDVINLLY